MKRLITLFISVLSLSIVLSQGSGCPEIDAGPDQTIPCSQTTATLNASVFNVGATTSYTVGSIPYAPPIAYNAAGGTGVSVNTDDVWSGAINLPFPFCFFGQTYNSCLIGSNGAINFATSNAGGYDPWPFSASVPSTNLVSAGNIFGIYHDIDPSVNGTVRYYLLGQAPCRTLIVSYNNLAHFDCNSLRSTFMMVLYETTNVIEVYVQNKQTCNSWNSGNAVIGIQNPAGTVGYVAPGRNTGNWTVSTPEAWQFKPSGAPIYGAIEWYQGATLIGTGATISVMPSPPTTTYTAKTTYTRCDGLTIPVQDDITVNYNAVQVVASPTNTFSCAGAPVTLTAYSNATQFVWNPGNISGQTIQVSPNATTTYTVTATNTANGCTATANATVTIAQPTNSACNVLYVSPTGTSSGDGTKAAPYDLITALEQGACNGTIVKMAVGDYVTDTAITKVTSYITLEGGFDPSLNWDKVSTAGATRILRTGVQTYSLVSTSIVQGNGIENETGANPNVTAIRINNQTGFRFQDLTIESQLNKPGTTMSGYQGVNVIGVEMNGCSAYNLVRTQILADAAANGAAQDWSIPATNGGSSTGLYLISNGANGNALDSRIVVGAAGIGGTGSPSGSNGTSVQVRLISGTALATSTINFNLPGQPFIRMDDISCTATNIGFIANTSQSWTFGTGSSPSSATGTNVISQYSNLGRKNINYNSNSYLGFANIILDSQVLPDFTTTAPFINGHYRICAGSQVGFTATNGGVGYVYVWDLDGGSSGPNTFNGTGYDQVGGTFNTPGIYTIQLNYETSCCGLSAPDSLILYVEEQPQAVMPPDANFCLGSPTGASLTVTGGVTNGSISWSPTAGLNVTDQYSVVALPTTTTTYFVTLTDSSQSCTDTGSVTVSVIDLQLTPSSTASNCATLGTASVAVSGGSGNYTYLWSDGQPTQTATNLQPGTYSVLVTDNIQGCQDSINVTVPAGPGALVGTMSGTDIICNGAGNGTATISISGGTSPYIYDWSNQTASSPTSNTTNTISNLSTGNYSVTVTDALSCTFDGNIEIEEPNPIVILVDSLLLPSCLENNDGHIEVRTDGGVRPYVYSWGNGTPIIVVNDEVIVNNASSDIYVLQVTDSVGCMDSISIDLTVDSLFGSIDTTVCYGTQITIPTVGLYTALVDTSVTVTLQNANGCDSTLTINVTINQLPTVVANASPNDTVCVGTQVTLTGSGASSYTWNNGVSNGTAFTPSVGTTNYIVTGTDANGCVNIDTIAITVNPLPTVVANASPNDTVCVGTQVTLTGSGASSYSWNNGVTNGTAFTPSVGTTNYIVTGTDANGCVNMDTIAITVNPLPTVVANASPNDTVCVGTQVTLTGSGASSFTWNNGVTNGTAFTPSVGTTNYIVTGTDANGCVNMDTIAITVNPLPTVVANASPNDTVCVGTQVTLTGSGASSYTWNNGVSNGTAFTPSVGTTNYIVTGTDANGCVNMDTIAITVNPLPTVVANASPNDTVCVGTQVTLTGSGASSYTWDNGVTDGTAFTPSVGTTNYIVTGTDANGCVNMDTIAITVNPLPTVVANVSPNDTVCVGTQVTLTGSGASSYTWDNGVTNGIAFTPSVGTTSYTLTGTDANGCVNTDIINITVNPLPVISINALPNDSVCDGDQVSLTASGATSYTWSNGITNGGSIVPPLGSSNYTVNGTDNNGCQNSANITLFAFDLPNVGANVLPNDTICEGDEFILNGSGASSYTWSNGVLDGVSFEQNVGTENYVVTGTDANGCISTGSITLTVNPTPAISATATPDTINIGGTSILEAFGSGVFEWDGTQSGAIYEVEPLTETTYSVTIVDANGCTNQTTITVYVIGVSESQLQIPNAFTPNGDNNNDIFRLVSDVTLSDVELNVYNRWGEQVHQGQGETTHGWDGTYKGVAQPVDVYTYTFKITTLNNETFFFTGMVSLFR